MRHQPAVSVIPECNTYARAIGGRATDDAVAPLLVARRGTVDLPNMLGAAECADAAARRDRRRVAVTRRRQRAAARRASAASRRGNR